MFTIRYRPISALAIKDGEIEVTYKHIRSQLKWGDVTVNVASETFIKRLQIGIACKEITFNEAVLIYNNHKFLFREDGSIIGEESPLKTIDGLEKRLFEARAALQNFSYDCVTL